MLKKGGGGVESRATSGNCEKTQMRNKEKFRRLNAPENQTSVVTVELVVATFFKKANILKLSEKKTNHLKLVFLFYPFLSISVKSSM